MKLKLQYFYLILFLFSAFCSFGQSEKWVLVSEKENNFSKKELKLRKNIPVKSKVYSLNYNAFEKNVKNILSKGRNVIQFPTAKGVEAFSIKEAPSMATELSEKFPMIKSFVGKGIDDPSKTVRFSFGTDGLHIIVFSAGDKTFYVDPYTNDNNMYIAYSKGDLSKIQSDFECMVDNEIKSNNNFSTNNANDGLLRTYRLALVCSGEYAQFHLNRQGVPSSATDAEKKAAVLSAMNTSMTRINGVYERDLGVKMEIVANNDKVIFLDASTDNITDGDAGTMINQVQTICDSEIGDADYDIGHIFSTGGSGLAGLGVVCVSGQKARGVTGIGTPVNDPYDIDYVAHEMGHQFGATHTQNNSCNRTNSTAVEPGSASTIMGYAGICAPNVQNNSDDHFHAVSIDQMWSTIQSSASCGATTSNGNSTPTSNAGEDHTIPKSTPFVLRGSGTDADSGNVLTYNWEQTDTEIATMPPTPTNTGGPAFRSISSSTSPNRYMPNLATVVAGNTSNTWEVVPSVSRDMNFSLVVRDNNAGGGNSERDNMKVTVDENAGPFLVTSQTTGITWDAGSTKTVTWDVAGTNTGDVNTPKVNIILSIDGGITFPYTLASDVDNDGSHSFTVPVTGGGDTTEARIIVEGKDNIFFAMNSSNFTIQESEFALAVASPEASVCSPNDAVYDITYNTFLGFTGTSTFSVSNLPTNATATFNPVTVSADGTPVTLTVSGISGVAPGAYDFKIIATSGAISKDADVRLEVFNGVPGNVTLTAPTDGNVDESITPTLAWDADDNSASYEIEVALDNTFTTIVNSGSSSSSSYVPSGLNQTTTYYWRVRGKSPCGTGSFSSVFSFTTLSCTACASVGNTTYDTSTTLVKFNTIDNATTKRDATGSRQGYFDYTAISTAVKRGETHEITIHVNTDDGAQQYTVHSFVWIDWNQDCNFDEANEAYDMGSATSTDDGPTDLSPLSITIPPGANLGSTVMRVSSKYNIDPIPCDTNFDGEVEDYTIIVEEATASIEDFAFSGFNIYPNPSKGEFNLNFEVVNTEKVSIQLFDIRGRLIGEKNFFDTNAKFSEQINFDKTSAGLYLVKITNGNKQTTRKLIIE
jgi:hypothetical protein